MDRTGRSLLSLIVFVVACDGGGSDRTPARTDIAGWYSLRGEASPGFSAGERDHLCLRADGTYIQHHRLKDGSVVADDAKQWNLEDGRVCLHEWRDYWRVTDVPETKATTTVCAKAQMSKDGTLILLVDPDRNVLYLKGEVDPAIACP